MVVSVFGATVALSGTAAATQAPSVNTVNPGTVDEGIQENGQVITFELSTIERDGNADTVQLVFPNRHKWNLANISAILNGHPDSVEAVSVSVTDDDGDGVDETLGFRIDDTGGGSASNVEVGFNADIFLPNVSSDTDLQIGLVVHDTDGNNIDRTFDTVTIRNDATADVPPGAC